MKKYRGHPPAAASYEEGALIPPRILRFMNNLPLGGDPVEWMIQFRDALMPLLGDVDRIAMWVHIDKQRARGERVKWSMHISQHIHVENSAKKIFVHPKVSLITDKDVLARKEEILHVLEEMRSLNYPLQDYQPPHCLRSAYRISILLSYGDVLFRRRGASPISKETSTAIVESLEPFFLLRIHQP